MSDGTEETQPWRPEADPIVLSLIGKVGEEACELGKACFRIVIQGQEGLDPATGEGNIIAAAKEMADVEAQIKVVRELLLYPIYTDRRELKERRSRRWMDICYPGVFGN